ncbi:hypothetical protein [Novosphingobium soli]|uniref:Uncharacterized protein n=1 Tax=Novosphingobium soli TaxID=574956 RepID=A0ABV6CT77_9SPHN
MPKLFEGAPQDTWILIARYFYERYSAHGSTETAKSFVFHAIRPASPKAYVSDGRDVLVEERHPCVVMGYTDGFFQVATRNRKSYHTALERTAMFSASDVENARKWRPGADEFSTFPVSYNNFFSSDFEIYNRQLWLW